MSVFRICLQQGAQGALDKNPATMYPGDVTGMGLGTPFSTSLQRQVYVMGPNRINRLFSDGQVFTDCNYWKQFAYPNVPMEQAFISVVTDDGSTWISGQQATVPVAVSGTVTPANSFAINFAAGTYTVNGGAATALSATGPALFCQLENTASIGTQPVTVLLNGTASFTLTGGATQIFNSGDLTVSSLLVTAGSGVSATFQVIASIESVCQS